MEIVENGNTRIAFAATLSVTTLIIVILRDFNDGASELKVIKGAHQTLDMKLHVYLNRTYC